MNAYNSLEFIVLPEVTYILNEHNLPDQAPHLYRRARLAQGH